MLFRFPMLAYEKVIEPVVHDPFEILLGLDERVGDAVDGLAEIDVVLDPERAILHHRERHVFDLMNGFRVQQCGCGKGSSASHSRLLLRQKACMMIRHLLY